jgi:hypothetical protein
MDVVVGNFGPGKDAPAITIWKNMGRPATQQTSREGVRRRASGTLPVAELARVQASCKPELWRVQLRVSYFLPLA